MNLLSSLLLILPDGSIALQDVAGLPPEDGVLSQAPRRVQVLLLGTVHQAQAIASADRGAGTETIEVTTVCGLTDTTDLWQYRVGLLLTRSAAWSARDRTEGQNPPCPRCFPPAPGAASANGAGEVSGG